MRSRKYRVFIIHALRDRAGKKQNGFMIALRPFGYWRRTVTMKPLIFVCERRFTSDAKAKNEADWLFGPLVWKRTPQNVLRGITELTPSAR
jgi:hypothetical protein